MPDSSPKRIALISGASGLLGSALKKSLRADGWDVFSLVRRTKSNSDEFSWDPEQNMVPVDELLTIPRIDAVINLSGASISKIPWTKSYRRELRESRLQSTNTLVAMIAQLHAENKVPQVFISASAYGFYGDRPGEILNEKSHLGEGFLPKLVNSWEESANQAKKYLRTVNIRTGLVLADSGFLATIRTLIHWFLGSKFGSGTQYWPWIHIYDEVQAIKHLIDSNIAGPVNLVAPETITSAEFIKTAAKKLKRPAFWRIPKLFIKPLGDAGEALLLADERIIPKVLQDTGFEWRYPELSPALDDLFAKF